MQFPPPTIQIWVDRINLVICMAPDHKVQVQIPVTHSIIFFLGDEKMTFNNTTLAIVGIIIIGILSTYMGNNELAAVALGGIVGWISRSYSNSGGIVNDPRC